MRLYRYVGSPEIASRSAAAPPGAAIRSAADLFAWIRNESPSRAPDGSVIATYVIDAAGLLRVADRHREHVSLCPGPVRAAGEVTLSVEKHGVMVASIDNRSSGFCPEPSSFAAVREALSSAGLNVPDCFDPEVIWRRCVACGTMNLVKLGVFECPCGAELPSHWNLDDPPGG